jgi:hypothetical protein
MCVSVALACAVRRVGVHVCIHKQTVISVNNLYNQHAYGVVCGVYDVVYYMRDGETVPHIYVVV